MESHPVKHPVVYLCIVIVFATLGGILNRHSTYFGDTAVFAGVLFGGCFGAFLALLWGLLVTLADL